MIQDSYQKQYYEANKEKVIERQKAYYQKTKNTYKHKQYQKKYREDNKEYHKEWMANWYKENRERLLEYQKNRYNMKKERIVSDEEFEKIFAKIDRSYSEKMAEYKALELNKVVKERKEKIEKINGKDSTSEKAEG